MPKGPVGLRKCHQLWLLGPSWLIHRKHTGTSSQETLVRSVSQNLSKNFTILCTRRSSHCAWPASTGLARSLRRVAAVWSSSWSGVRAERWRSAVAGRTCPCPLPRRLPRAATLPANIIITINIIVAITIIILLIMINQDHCYSATAPTPRLL